MRNERIADFRLAIKAGRSIDVTIVMPCLNEFDCLPHCIANAQDALAAIQTQLGLCGEIVIADNGSTDGSQALAASLGARVVAVPQRGYGAALIGGANAAFGRYVLMGDADGSYDFTDGIAMIRSLHDGAELCMGSRFKGGIAPGAMPWKNRHIGNPVLTGILNILFRARIDDAHCGLRAIRKDAFLGLGLTGTGMEFASEMVIKAALKQLTITQAPAKLLADLRDRPPHLRPWRDGWRHLRYLFMLSPTWLFAVPGVAAMGIAACVLLVALAHLLGALHGETPFGTSWTIAAGFLFTTGHLAAILALATHLSSVRQGYRRLGRVLTRHARALTLETMLAAGAAMILLSLIGLLGIGSYWRSSGFAALPNTLPLVLAALLGAVGAQNVLGGFLLAIIAGHEAKFMPAPPLAALPLVDAA
ncbi:glycosyltransferase family 2 protein [Sphingomonas sp. PB2P19]|uniref:glycosyltransferase family 2 protein n=1 Tax=Sphingomonas rhamnosi TaxID=3096156 RepID=UPI002FC998D7